MRALFVFLPLALAACGVGPGDGYYSEWTGISETDARLRIVAPAEVDLPDFTVESRIDTVDGEYNEFWDWPSGSLFFAELAREGVGFGEPFTNFRNLSEWDYFEEIKLEFSREDMRKGTNNIGHYVYAISDTNNAGLVCFSYSQGLAKGGTPDYDFPPDWTNGFIQAFDCQPTDSISKEEYAETMRGFVDGLARRKK